MYSTSLCHREEAGQLACSQMLSGIITRVSYLAGILSSSAKGLSSKGQRDVCWKHEWIRTEGLRGSVIATSVSGAIGKSSPVTIYIYSEIMTKKCTSSRQMKWRCKLESHLRSHFGITSCLDKQHLLSLPSWQVAAVNTCIRDQSQQITVKFGTALQEAASPRGAAS